MLDNVHMKTSFFSKGYYTDSDNNYSITIIVN